MAEKTLKGLKAALQIAILLVAVGFSMEAQASRSPEGQWTGTYSCLQGETALDLSITPVDETHYAALFHFTAPSSNPRVPEGCFTMTGVLDPSSGHLVFEPKEWILRPVFFVSVALDGMLDPSGQSYSGHIVGGMRCTTFQLTRSDTPDAAYGKCNEKPTTSVDPIYQTM